MCSEPQLPARCCLPGTASVTPVSLRVISTATEEPARGGPGAPCSRQVHTPVTCHTCALGACYHCCHQSRLPSASAAPHKALPAAGIQHLSGAQHRLNLFQKCGRNSLKAVGSEQKVLEESLFSVLKQKNKISS